MFEVFTVKYTVEYAAIDQLEQIAIKTSSILERLNAESDN